MDSAPGVRCYLRMSCGPQRLFAAALFCCSGCGPARDEFIGTWFGDPVETVRTSDGAVEVLNFPQINIVLKAQGATGLSFDSSWCSLTATPADATHFSLPAKRCPERSLDRFGMRMFCKYVETITQGTISLAGDTGQSATLSYVGTGVFTGCADAGPDVGANVQTVVHLTKRTP